MRMSSEAAMQPMAVCFWVGDAREDDRSARCLLTVKCNEHSTSRHHSGVDGSRVVERGMRGERAMSRINYSPVQQIEDECHNMDRHHYQDP